jgi:aminoglycoside 3-N-acetyltransferase
MGNLGWMPGGAQAIIEALLEVVGQSGTLMMPAFSGDLSDPAEWKYPAAPPDKIGIIRDSMPAFDPERTPTKSMGTVAELFRNWPGVRRSGHPQSSFAAFGRAAEQLLACHGLSNRFGPNSPLQKLVDLEGKVLLLGAPRDTISLFHLTQHLVEFTTKVNKAAPMLVGCRREWVKYEDVEYPIQWFEKGLQHLFELGIATLTKVNTADTIVFPAKPAIERIVEWRIAQNV